jgi:hypothetical protein
MFITIPSIAVVLIGLLLSTNFCSVEQLLFESNTLINVYAAMTPLNAENHIGHIRELITLNTSNSTGDNRQSFVKPCLTNNAYSPNGSSGNNSVQAAGAGEVFRFSALPPLITMNYTGKVYCGTLSDYKYRVGMTFTQLQIPNKKVTSDLPPKLIKIRKGSNVKFIMNGFPKLLPPTNLAVGAYSANNGTAIKLLNSTNSDSTVIKMDLPKGRYILLTTATWLPRAEDITGYTIYKFLVNII